MTEERKHAILLATVILTARRLQPLLEDFAAGKPNMGTEYWAEVYTKRSIERAAHILDLIDEKWPAGELGR
jgi:hypothetical protein